MASDPITLQAAIFLLSLLLLLFSIKRLGNQPTRSKPRRTTTTKATTATTNHHFLHLLNPHKPPPPSSLKSVLSESQALISLSPKDPSPRLLRALALDHMGHKRSALRALDSALLIPSRVKSLSRQERAGVLLRRAELKLSVSRRRRRVDSAVEDLKECVGLSWDMDELGVRALCLLGECYEMKGLWDDAKGAFMDALRAEPECDAACSGIQRLRGFGTIEA